MKSHTFKTIILGLSLTALSLSGPLKKLINNQFEKCITILSNNCTSVSNPVGF